jgi:hypothetical protein
MTLYHTVSGRAENGVDSIANRGKLATVKKTGPTSVYETLAGHARHLPWQACLRRATLPGVGQLNGGAGHAVDWRAD